jgi:predicted transposase YdaD
MQLTIVSDEEMVEQGRLLIERVQLEQADTIAKNELIDIITTAQYCFYA